MHNHTDSNLNLTIIQSPHEFLQPTSQLHNQAIDAIKNILDPLAKDVNHWQLSRRNENRRKRKRVHAEEEDPVLQIRQIYTSGLGVKQVWEQAKRVLDATCSEIDREISLKLDTTTKQKPDVNGHYSSSDEETESSSTSSSIPQNLDHNNPDNLIENVEDEDNSSSDVEDEILEESDEHDTMGLTDEDDMDSDADKGEKTYVQDPNGLNDGFFSIDDFNRQSQFLEQQDARGADDNPSDEDEIDWDADLLSMPFPRSKRTDGNENEVDEDMVEDDADEEGPTFGNADINADESDDSEDEERDGLEDDLLGLNNTNDILYADFFEPPPKKLDQKARNRALPKTQPPQVSLRSTEDDIEKDLQRAMADVRRDLLDSEDEVGENDVESDDEINPQRAKNLSTHEKQRAQIAAEIRRLEAASVAKRDWTLTGEARAIDRPINSLLEEDLEFERVGKPVPVITADFSEEIEQLIKRRILAREFDEIVRRRPDAIGAAADTRRGRVEVDDRKSQTGLAEIYEEEHLKQTDAGYVDKRSAATKKQHEEIDRLWKEVSSQLDLLTNLHFKPKRIEIEMKTVEDKPVISMEDARPVGMGGDESMLAPQEIYKPGEDGKANGEVVRKSGANVSKEEMTREEKLRKRRREKERMKKALGNKVNGTKQNGVNVARRKGKSEEKQDILTDLKKGNVKVIGKRGELQDLGKQRSTGTESKSSSAFKL